MMRLVQVLLIYTTLVTASSVYATDYFIAAKQHQDASEYHRWLSKQLTASEQNVGLNRQALLQSFQKQADALNQLLTKDPSYRNSIEKLALNNLYADLTDENATNIDVHKHLTRIRNTENDLPRAYLSPLKLTLARYAVLLEIAQADDKDALFETHLKPLTLFTFTKEHGFTMEHIDLYEVQDAVAWFNLSGLYAEFVQAFKQRYQTPNAYVSVNTDLFKNVIEVALPDDITMPVETVTADGTVVRGNARAVATAHPTSVSAASKAIIKVELRAAINANTVATRKKVSASSSSYSKVFGTQHLVLDGLNLSFPRASIRADSSIDFNHVRINWNRPRLQQRNFGARFVGNVLERRKSEIEAENESLLVKSLHEKLNEEISKLQLMYEDARERFLYTPFAQADIALTAKTRTTSSHILLDAAVTGLASVTLANRDQVAVPDHHLKAEIHESALNTVAQLVNGDVVEERAFRELLFSKLGAQMSDEEADEFSGVTPATLTFADEGAVAIRINEDGLHFDLLVQGFEAEEETYDQRSIKISASYAVQAHEGGLILSRNAEIAVQPLTGKASGEDFDALSEVVQRFFPKRLVTSAMDVKINEKTIGKMAVQSVSTTNSGWLVETWSLLPQTSSH